ncbi:hypothetical protein CH063_04290 [Colletotrichum higginsianum]|uniref:Uncharacterized protein n=1 Tax=Colletotrichum higginsianum (strain IMI 349063) TaxID=759273 RepID=H1W5P7_COLHI|nr:hypothetical protein CH63R_05108 [Colletotrichum higginsianum IMI 349063]OBR12812.1 hypothetical protein CH63R_05108 [Colletotrichum higginsianum IMI 349063]CCF47811.1 hypothetical protein CH063_04290 [Colletotrichum higginsianum]
MYWFRAAVLHNHCVLGTQWSTVSRNSPTDCNPPCQGNLDTDQRVLGSRCSAAEFMLEQSGLPSTQVTTVLLRSPIVAVKRCSTGDL